MAANRVYAFMTMIGGVDKFIMLFDRETGTPAPMTFTDMKVVEKQIPEIKKLVEECPGGSIELVEYEKSRVLETYYSSKKLMQ